MIVKKMGQSCGNSVYNAARTLAKEIALSRDFEVWLVEEIEKAEDSITLINSLDGEASSAARFKALALDISLDTMKSILDKYRECCSTFEGATGLSDLARRENGQ